jgi:hypothetical protein
MYTYKYIYIHIYIYIYLNVYRTATGLDISKKKAGEIPDLVDDMLYPLSQADYLQRLLSSHKTRVPSTRAYHRVLVEVGDTLINSFQTPVNDLSHQDFNDPNHLDGSVGAHVISG